jgi:import inner membrane translocase subunit TIM50
MARDNRPNRGQGQKNSTDFSRSPGVQSQKGPGGASAAFKSPQQGARSSDNSGRPNYSNKQDEVSRGARPERNTIPQSAGTGAESVNAAQRNEESQEFSQKQKEFDTKASPSENTAPQFTSPSAIDPAEVKAPSQPLPDLTRGIPSTLEYETTGSTHKSPLNLMASEDPVEGSSGGRGKGELPASAYISSSEKRRLKFANYMYGMFAVAAAGGTVYLGRNWESDEEEKAHPDAPSGWAIGLMWNRANARLHDQLNYYNEPAFRKLLPDPDPMFERPYTLVLGMEDLLIHSEWTREHGWRMAKRPGVDYFLRYLSQYYELVIFTTQPSALAEPVIRKLDPFHIATWPLFREATLYENGEYIKVI